MKRRFQTKKKFLSIALAVLPAIVVFGLVWSAEIYYDLDTTKVMVEQIQRVTQRLEAASDFIVSGISTTTDVYPSADATYVLGASAFRWANIYTATTTIGGTVTIDTDDVRASGTLVVTAQAGDLIATSSNHLYFVSDGIFSVTSTEYVSFATADSEKLRILSGGNVGIGTSTPTAVLHIIQTAAADAFRVDDETNESTPFVVDQSGNVGVGSSTPSTVLAVQGNFIGSGNLVLFGSTTSTIANSFTVDTNVLFVDSYANQVGIGTVTPDFALEVSGTGFFSTSAGFGGTATTTGTALTFDGVGNITTGAASYWQASAGNLNITSAAGIINVTGTDVSLEAVAGNVSATSSLDIYFATAATERMRILSTGNVGIATTSPRGLLDVWGDAYFGTTTVTATPTMFVDSGNGRVGIGTVSPLAALDVRGPIEEGLVAWWSMDSTTTDQTILDDQSINSNDGTLYGEMATSTTYGWVTGKFNQALSFDGSDDYVEVPHSASLDITGAFTIEVWLNIPTASAVNAYLIAKREGGTDQYNIVINADTKVSLSSIGGASTNLLSNTALSRDQWYHIVAGTDGTTGFIYLDGVEDKTGALTAPTTQVVNLYIAARGGTPPAGYLNATIDEVRIYNRALSAREIHEHYRQKAPSLAQGGTVSDDLYIMNDGNVGIGTTTPTFGLELNTSTTDGFFGVSQGYGNTPGNLFTIDGSGNVGIGSSTPGFVLTTAGHVVPSTDNTYALGQTNLRWSNLYAATTTIGGTVTIDTDDVRASGALTVTSQAGDLIATSSNHLYFVSDGIFSVTSTEYVSFATADSEKMRILSSGYVGIGSTTPTRVLEVKGECVTGDTLLPIVNYGSRTSIIQIKDIKGGEYVLSLNEETQQIEPHKIKGLLDKGVQPVFKLTTESGRSIRTTGNHPYLVRHSVSNSWTEVKYLKPGDEIAVPSVAFFSNKKPAFRADSSEPRDNPMILGSSPITSIAYQNTLSSPSEYFKGWTRGELHPGDSRRRPEISDYPGPTQNILYQNSTQNQSNILWDKIISIDYAGYEQVYDIEVEGTHNFIGNNIFAHNTYMSATTTIKDGLVVGGSKLFVSQGGNVGIGTVTPAYTLDVSGTGKFTTSLGVAGTATTTGASITFAGAGNITTAAASTWKTTAGNLTITSGAGVLIATGTDIQLSAATGNISATSSNDIYFATNNAERMRINSLGQVGIGTTTLAGLFTVGTTTPALVVSPLSYVGIGTASPGSALDIDGQLIVRGEWGGRGWNLTYDGGRGSIHALAVYNGKLYAGRGLDGVTGDVLVFDGTTWSTSFDGLHDKIHALAVYNGKLYAGQGDDAGEGDIFVFDGTTWSTSTDGAQESIRSLAVYNGKLYAGQGENTGDGDVLVFDGTTWSTSYNGALSFVASLAVYNGKLYASQGTGTGLGDILVFDGTTWSTSYDGTYYDASYALAVYNGKLYAGQGNLVGEGDVLVFDGTTWSTSFDGWQKDIFSLAVYNGKLYAGQGDDNSGSGVGDIFVFDGLTWSTSSDGAQEAVASLAVYNGKLYAGKGSGIDDDDVYVFEENLGWQIAELQTKTDYLSWSQADRDRHALTIAANVGIGTTTPSDTFSVQGNIISSGNIILYGTATSTFDAGVEMPEIKLTTGAVNRYVLMADADGDASWQSTSTLGIVTSFWEASGANALKPIDLDGIIVSASSTIMGDLTVGRDALFVDESTGYVGIATTSPRGLLDVWGDVYLGTTTDTNVPVLYVDSGNGKVGIGTTTHDYLLTVAGNVNLGTSSDSTLYIGGGFGKLTAGTIDPPTGDLKIAVSSGSLSATSSQDIYFATAATERMRILSTGNIGIGTTTPGTKLTIVETGQANPLTVWANATTVFSVDVSGNIQTAGSMYQDIYGSDDGLVLYLPFSEGMTSSSANTAYDRSPYGNDGTATNMPMPTRNATSGESGWSTTTCKVGSCMSFDGTDDYVVLGDKAIWEFGTGDFTVAVWLKTAVADSPGVVSGYDGFNTHATFRINQAIFHVFGQGGWGTSVAPDNVLSDNVWHFVVGVRESSVLKMYVDGVQQADTDTNTIDIDSTQADLRIGFDDAQALSFSGSIDEVRIYNRALSADEIRAHYLRGTGAGGAVLADKFRIIGTDNNVDFVVNDGNVGIGSSSPAFVLTTAGHVVPSTDNTYALGQTNLRWSNLYAATTTIGGTITIDTDDVRASGALTVTSQAGDLIATSSNHIYFVSDGIFSVTSTEYISFATADSEKMRITSAGNVGIGTSTPATTLDIYGNMLLDGTDRYLNFNSVVGTSGYGIRDNSGTIEYKASGDAWAAIGSGGGGGSNWWVTSTTAITPTSSDYGLLVYASSTFTGDLTVGTNALLFVDVSEGNVGIGSSSPAFVLTTAGHVVPSTDNTYALGQTNLRWSNLYAATTTIGGTITIDTDDIRASTLLNITTQAGNLTVTSSNNLILVSDGYLSVTSTDYISFATADSEKMRITSAGNVGIGTTSPSHLLEVDGTLYVDDAATIDNNLIVSGQIGIGTTPGQPLDISKANTAILVRITEAGAGDYYAGFSAVTDGVSGFLLSHDDSYSTVPAYAGTVTLASDGGSLQLVTEDSGDDIEFYAGGRTSSELRMFIEGTNGNVGIGTTTPRYLLDVWGNVALGTTTDTNVPLLYVDSGNGNIGIGDITPGSLLTVTSTGAIALGNFNDDIIDNMESTLDDWTSSDSTNAATSTQRTIVKVGDQSLNIAASGDSEDDTVRKTYGSAQDWSAYERIGFWIYADRLATSTATTTQLISFAYYDTGGTETTTTIDIVKEDRWQYQEIAMTSTAADKDAISYIQFRIDFDNLGTINFYVDHIRLYDDNEKTGEMFVDNDGSLVLMGRDSVEIFAPNTGSGVLPGVKVDSAVVEIGQPLSVNVGGDVGFDYDIFFANTGMSQITSEGALRIAAGDPNHAESLTLTTGGTGDVIVELANASSTFMIRQSAYTSTTAFIINSEINTTSTPSNGLFRIITDVNSDEDIKFMIDPAGRVGIGTSTLYGWLTVGSFDVATLVVTTDNKVGIGTTTPAYMLTVAGNADIGSSSDSTLLVGGGGGKLTAGTLDPLFNIDGRKYATYVASMSGVREEITGVIQVDQEYVIDFNTVEEDSKLWIFYRITDFGENWQKLTVLLSAEGPSQVWYEKNSESNQLIIHSEVAPSTGSGQAVSVSYRLTAPRFDWKKWLSVIENGRVGGLMVGEIINNQYAQATSTTATSTAGLLDEQASSTDGQAEASLFDAFVQKIKQALNSLGLWIEDGVAKVKTLIAENLEVGSPEKPAGITIYDEETGEPYCLKMKAGQMVSAPGECNVEGATSTDQTIETCENGTNRPCSTDVGACQIGVEVCEQGVWGECLGAVMPTEEICDEVDNDCDGEIDEGGVCGSPTSQTSPEIMEVGLPYIGGSTSTDSVATSTEPIVESPLESSGEDLTGQAEPEPTATSTEPIIESSTTTDAIATTIEP